MAGLNKFIASRNYPIFNDQNQPQGNLNIEVMVKNSASELMMYDGGATAAACCGCCGKAAAPVAKAAAPAAGK